MRNSNYRRSSETPLSTATYALFKPFLSTTCLLFTKTELVLSIYVYVLLNCVIFEYLHMHLHLYCPRHFVLLFLCDLSMNVMFDFYFLKIYTLLTSLYFYFTSYKQAEASCSQTHSPCDKAFQKVVTLFTFLFLVLLHILCAAAAFGSFSFEIFPS